MNKKLILAGMALASAIIADQSTVAHYRDRLIDTHEFEAVCNMSYVIGVERTKRKAERVLDADREPTEGGIAFFYRKRGVMAAISGC